MRKSERHSTGLCSMFQIPRRKRADKISWQNLNEYFNMDVWPDSFGPWKPAILCFSQGLLTHDAKI